MSVQNTLSPDAAQSPVSHEDMQLSFQRLAIASAASACLASAALLLHLSGLVL